MILDRQINTDTDRRAEWYVKNEDFRIQVLQRHNSTTLTWDQPYIDIRMRLRIAAGTAIQWIFLYNQALDEAIRQFEAWQKDTGKARTDNP